MSTPLERLPPNPKRVALAEGKKARNLATNQTGTIMKLDPQLAWICWLGTDNVDIVPVMYLTAVEDEK
jgi:hypothetical protein